jgi:hypothetical protein
MERRSDSYMGFVVGILFLELNGYRFVASEEDAAQAVLKLAAGTLDEADYSSFLRGNVVCRKKIEFRSVLNCRIADVEELAQACLGGTGCGRREVLAELD